MANLFFCCCSYTETAILFLHVASGQSHDAMLGKCFLRTARLGWDWWGDRGHPTEMWLFRWEESVWRGVRTQAHCLPPRRWDGVYMWLQWPRPTGTREGKKETRYSNTMLIIHIYYYLHSVWSNWNSSFPPVRTCRGFGCTDHCSGVMWEVPHTGP